MAGKAWLAVARVADIGTRALQAMRARLGPPDRRRLARFTSRRRRTEFLAGRWLVEQSRAAWCGNPRARTSIAHSGGWVACALACGACGVDIEPSVERDFAKLGAWTFGDAWLPTGADPRSVFYRRWTAYEAELKARRGMARTWIGKGVAVSACLTPRTPLPPRSGPMLWRRSGFTPWPLPKR